MKKISSLFLFAISISLAACAAGGKQVKPVTAEKAEVSEAAKAANVAEVPAAEAPVKVVVPPVVMVHIVRPNENLEKIAKLPEVYGNRKMWPVLFEGNRDQLIHPSKIYPGQKLRIPREPAEIAALEKRAGMNKVVLVSDQALKEAQAAKQRAAVHAAAVKLPPRSVTNPVEEALKPQAASETTASTPSDAVQPEAASNTDIGDNSESADSGAADSSGLEVDTDTDDGSASNQ